MVAGEGYCAVRTETIGRRATLTSMRISRIAGVIVATSTALLLAGCTGASIPPGHTLGPLSPQSPKGEVVGQGTVMDIAGDVTFCMGAIRESWPPQCDGMPLKDWSWDGVEGMESSDDIRWGAYALTGTYDGTSFTLNGPPMLLALYDPMPPADPTGGKAGTTSEARLVEIQDQLPDILVPGTQYFSSWPDRGYLWVQVVWDDGTIQDGLDAHFGKDVVVVQSALREIG